MDILNDVCEYFEKSFDLRKVALNFKIEEFPPFLIHIFGVWDEKNKKWTMLSSDSIEGRLKLIPSVIFSRKECIEFLLEFLNQDIRMLTLLVAAIVEEKHRSFWVDILPSLIFMIIAREKSKTSSQDYEKSIWRMYSKTSKVFDKVAMNTVIKENISTCVSECIQYKCPLSHLVAEKMCHNEDFRKLFTSWDIFTFTTDVCLCNTMVLRWNQIETVEVQDDQNGVGVILGYYDGITEYKDVVKMKSKVQCDATIFVLRQQLDVMKPYHCARSRTHGPRSCVKNHWTFSALFHSSSLIHFSQLRSQDHHLPPSYQSMGKNCNIKIITLKKMFNNFTHVLVKELFDCELFKAFWQMVSVYQGWCHPNIMRFLGLVEGSLAIFREHSTTPLITYLINLENKSFTFSDVRIVLMEIGSALHYLHEGLHQNYGNLNLQRIMMVQSTYKLCEPPLDKRRNKAIYNLGSNLSESDDKIYDVIQLLYSIMAIFYINESMYREQISIESFERTQCNSKMKTLIKKWISEPSVMETILNDLYNTSFTQEEMECVVVKSDNKFVPEFLRIVVREANMFKVADIDFSKLRLNKTIGQGHFSSVYSATYRSHGNEETNVAVKKFKATNLVKNLKEIRNSMMGFHPNVLKSIGFSTNNGHLYIITELGESSLLHHLKKNRLSREICLDFSMQICEGMILMSDLNKIIHRDLAARNVIVFNTPGKYTLKISDFGLTLLLKDDKDYYTCGDIASKCWVPKEDLEKQRYSRKTDIYSFGVVMWEIFSGGKSPVNGLERYEGVGKEMDVICECHSEKEVDRPENFGAVMNLLKNLSIS